MSSVAIKVDNIGKRYRLGVGSTMDRTFRELIHDSIRGVTRKLTGKTRASDGNGEREGQYVWALRGASFEVKRGEVVGVIGSNGAGKSTLLKVLSRITDPSAGQAEIHGRVGSLLEVGTGFHPELTGRENIFLNGAILGMRRAEIKSKFDEIIAFAEVEKFLDTPVKRYSSGMYVRLAFAVAAHLEPEILVVDEVLAVGDAKFQQKCLGKMQDIASHGRTVLFVSHNMGAVETLCSRGIVLQQGRIVEDADTKTAIAKYLSNIEESGAIEIADRTDRSGKGDARLTKLELLSGPNHQEMALKTGDTMRVVFHVSKVHPDLRVIFSVYDSFGQSLVDYRSRFPGDDDLWDDDMKNKVICDIPRLLLVPGRYRMDVEIWADGEFQDMIAGAAFFDVTPGHVDGRPVTVPIRRARAIMPHRWIMPGRMS